MPEGRTVNRTLRGCRRPAQAEQRHVEHRGPAAEDQAATGRSTAQARRASRGPIPGAVLRYHFAGHFTGSGNSAVGRFYINNCASASVPRLARGATVEGRARRDVRPGGRVRFRRGVGDDRHRRFGEREQRDDRQRDLVDAGKFGGALQFNGTSSRVTIPDSASLHLSSGMTLEAWVNPSTVNAQVARRHLQGQRQLLSRGDVDATPRVQTPGRSRAGATPTRSVPRRCRRARGRIWRRPMTGRRCVCTSTARRWRRPPTRGRSRHRRTRCRSAATASTASSSPG